MTALLLKLKAERGSRWTSSEFYELATDPPATLLEDYPWLRAAWPARPSGADPTLEGFLWPATYRVLPDTTRRGADPADARQVHRAAVGEERLNVPKDRGMTFYAGADARVDRRARGRARRGGPLIAGVYQNRINGINGVKNRLLNADPTVIYGDDTVALAEHADFDDLAGLRLLEGARGRR